MIQDSFLQEVILAGLRIQVNVSSGDHFFEILRIPSGDFTSELYGAFVFRISHDVAGFKFQVQHRLI